LGVFLYFLFTYILENYLVEQENFDPSLVPVSSIVTLAKVAQKLVNGNGTLTNPGNLQIGKDMQATGNLTVTGKTAIGSTTMGDKTLNVTGTLGVSGDTTVGGGLSVKGNFETTGSTNLFKSTQGNQTWFPFTDGKNYIRGDTIIDGNTELSGVKTPLLIKKGAESPDNTKIQFGDGTGWRLRFQKDDANPIMDIVDNKNVDVHGRLTIPHSVWHQSSDGKNRLHYGNNTHTFFGTNDGYIWRSSADRDLMSLNGAGELTVGNLNVTGSIRVGNFNIGREANGITIRSIKPGAGDHRVYIPDWVYKDL
jgi:hypothetical protein